jgi:hypothetical protein
VGGAPEAPIESGCEKAIGQDGNASGREEDIVAAAAVDNDIGTALSGNFKSDPVDRLGETAMHGIGHVRRTRLADTYSRQVEATDIEGCADCRGNRRRVVAFVACRVVREQIEARKFCSRLVQYRRHNRRVETAGEKKKTLAVGADPR